MVSHTPRRRVATGALGVLLWAPAAAASAAPLMCLAPGAAAPCAAQSEVGPVSEPAPDTGVSNPIGWAHGEKFLRHVDLPEPRDAAYPGFVRHHHSGRVGGDDPLGTGWRHQYDVRLVRHAAGWRLHLPDGRIHDFDARGLAYEAAGGRIVADGGGHRWEDAFGQALGFDAAGRLRLLCRAGQTDTHVTYHTEGAARGLVHTVRRGPHVLRLHHAPDAQGTPRLSWLDTPLGRFHYAYARADDGVAQLQRVTRPDGQARRYLHEPARQAGHAHAITGVVLEGLAGRTQRVRSWTYDARGRVIEAVPGPPTQARGRLRLRYESVPGQARVHTTQLQGPAGTLRLTGPARPRRAQALPGLRIERGVRGRIERLHPAGGWPGLVLHYDHAGRRSAWHSTLTGTTRLRYDARGHLAGVQGAGGRTQTVRHDAQGRPVRVLHQAPGTPDDETTLRWRGDQLRQVRHHNEVEHLDVDPVHQRVTRRIERPHPAGTLRYTERFEYDAAGRLVAHQLPEGGRIIQRWGPEGRLAAITWQDAGGQRHVVIDSQAGRAGYRWGNGVWLQARRNAQGHADALLVVGAHGPLWGERRDGDARGVPARQHIGSAVPAQRQVLHLAHDPAGRLISWQATLETPTAPTTPTTATPSVPPGSDAHWLAWNDSGALRASQPAQASPQRGRDGLARRLGARTLQYDAQGRLARVQADGADQPLATYTHNGRGQLIRTRHDLQETERYLVNNRLAATWTRPPADPSPVQHDGKASATFGVTQRHLYAGDVPVGLLQTDADGRTTLFYVHADLLGTPVLVTDAQQRVRWAARHDPLGRATRVAGDLRYPLRRPGQDEDPATGWHHNGFRTLLPDHGQYLEPDPLGPLPGQQALGYAAQRPLRRTDPLGLLLLAFDGTRMDRDNASNVWKLGQAYADGRVLYQAGPGNNRQLDWDALVAASSSQILRDQWQALMGELAQARDAGARQPVPLDILGYSRGAALARDFANQVAAHVQDGWFSYDDPLRGPIGLCVDLRFLGLFDTVAQFGLLGAANAGFDLSITDAWSWVAHAVALHERRSLFPLVLASDGSGVQVHEVPFIGAHGDIGGGLLLDAQGVPRPDGDLSDVALNWMHWQALAAQVPLAVLAPDDRVVTQALLHDARSPWQRSPTGDRQVQNSDTQTIGPQGAHASLGEAQRAQFEAYITRIAGWELNAGSVVGTVDMQAYGVWLRETLGLDDLYAPDSTL